MTYTSEKRPADWRPEVGQSFIDPDKRRGGRIVTVDGFMGSYGCTVISDKTGNRTAMQIHRLRYWRGTWEPTP